jgi:hypothetical protein
MRRSWFRSTILGAVCIAAAVLGAVAAVACGSGQSLSSPVASGVAVSGFDSSQGKFSIRYPTGFVQIEPTTTGTDSGLVYQVFFADPAGAKSGDRALDVLGVTVRRLSRAARPGDLKKHEAEFKAIAAQLIGRPDALAMVTPLRLARLDGRQALKAEYVYRVGEVDVAAVAYLVPAGKRVYWVTGQASKGTWRSSGRVIGASMMTFALKE